MSTDRPLCRLAGAVALAILAAMPLAGHTQSSAPGAAPTTGSGQGFHSPQSAVPPLQERPGVLSWGTLSGVTMKQEGKRTVPVFPPQVSSLAGKKVKVQGFMLPLQPGEQQSHFLLSAVPTTCSFCLPAGPEGIVEVRIRGAGVKVGFDAMVLEGTLAVLNNDPMGLLYRLTDAQASR